MIAKELQTSSCSILMMCQLLNRGDMVNVANDGPVILGQNSGQQEAGDKGRPPPTFLKKKCSYSFGRVYIGMGIYMGTEN